MNRIETLKTEKDGLDVTAFQSGVRTIPVEATESVAPILFRRREFREGSGGAGCHRGGLGQIIELGGVDGTPIAMLCNFERVANPARGGEGGGNGASGRVTLAGLPKFRFVDGPSSFSCATSSPFESLHVRVSVPPPIGL